LEDKLEVLIVSNHFERFIRNIDRVNNLNALFGIAKNTRKRPTIKEADILRASVVFLHSALEDYIRGILVEFIPKQSDIKTLNSISLLGSEGRPEKFSLGQLKDYEEQTVKDLIEASVKEHMSKISFNNCTDLSSWLRKISIDVSRFHQFDKVDNMILRRHKIVHEVDTNRTYGRGNHSATSINLPTVNSWLNAVKGLVDLIEEQITRPTYCA